MKSLQKKESELIKKERKKEIKEGRKEGRKEGSKEKRMKQRNLKSKQAGKKEGKYFLLILVQILQTSYFVCLCPIFGGNQFLNLLTVGHFPLWWGFDDF